MVARYIGCMAQPSPGSLALLFGRIGNLTFGGGDPTMAALYQELVARRRWLTAEQYGLIWSLARVTPGTNLLAFCVGVGWRLAGLSGALAAVLALTLPSAAIVVWLTYACQALRANAWAMAAIAGVLAAAVGMMLTGAWQILRPHLKARTWPRAVVISGGALVLARLLALNPIAVLALGALAGAFWISPDETK
jgi:chromate transporter